MTFHTNTDFEIGKSYIVKIYERELINDDTDKITENYIQTNIMNKTEYRVIFHEIKNHGYQKIDNKEYFLGYSYLGTNELNCEFQLTRLNYVDGEFVLYYSSHRDIAYSIIEEYANQDAAMLKYKRRNTDSNEET